MQKLDTEFRGFHEALKITYSKNERLRKSKENLRNVVKKYFSENHPKYKPMFFTQGSYKMKTCIRTKDDTCDIDDGIYFKDNPDNVNPETLQLWVKKAVEGITDSTVTHKSKCITIDYKAGYNIDLPVYLFDKDKDEHPYIAIKNIGWESDDPREMVESFISFKKDNEQKSRIVKYLKAWCDNKREKMPSGLAMTILVMSNYIANISDSVSLKYTLVSIKNSLLHKFECIVPATPHDDIFDKFCSFTGRKEHFLDNLDSFIDDAIKAINEDDSEKACILWRKHLGERFPVVKNAVCHSATKSTMTGLIGNSKPYAE